MLWVDDVFYMKLEFNLRSVQFEGLMTGIDSLQMKHISSGVFVPVPNTFIFPFAVALIF